MTTVFISYDQSDSDFATVAKLELERAGYEVWLDRFRIRAGDDWRSEIDGGLASASALIAVMSPEAAMSQYVTYEWAFALGCGLTVIPLVLRPAEMHPRLATLQYLDFSNPRTRPWSQLLEILGGAEMAVRGGAKHAEPKRELSALDRAELAIESINPEERWLGLETLGGSSDPRALDKLKVLLEHPLRDVRVFAATRVVDTDPAAALPALAEGLRYP
jgi:TIR domain-containing protein